MLQGQLHHDMLVDLLICVLSLTIIRSAPISWIFKSANAILIRAPKLTPRDSILRKSIVLSLQAVSIVYVMMRKVCVRLGLHYLVGSPRSYASQIVKGLYSRARMLLAC